jgi:uncharacterized damage-inducible protein DinB
MSPTEPSPPSFHALARALVDELNGRLFKDSAPRLEKCLARLTEEEIWFRPNAETVSVGNLVLHLCGNVRQYIISGLGGASDVRARAREFSEKGPVPTGELLGLLRSTLSEARKVMEGLDLARLLEVRRVQGFDCSVVGILIHVVEHFSYHVGQVTYSVKSRKGIDMKYHEGVDLNQTSG